jgi:hypothetical protein
MRRQHLFIFIFLLVGNVNGVVWDANNYPNPTTQAGAKLCGLRSAGNLCDPDGILTEEQRYRINHELSRLESKTYQEFGRNFCEKKGLTGVIGLAKQVKGGTEADVRKMATDLRQVGNKHSLFIFNWFSVGIWTSSVKKASFLSFQSMIESTQFHVKLKLPFM